MPFFLHRAMTSFYDFSAIKKRKVDANKINSCAEKIFNGRSLLCDLAI